MGEREGLIKFKMSRTAPLAIPNFMSLSRVFLNTRCRESSSLHFSGKSNIRHKGFQLIKKKIPSKKK
jgi:hypothetical protein